MVSIIARVGQRWVIVGAMTALIASMLLLSRMLTTNTPVAYYALPLIFYAFCLSPLLPAVGSGTVARIEQNKLLDGVSLYMTFRQLGASVGVALLTYLIDSRESLHSSRLFENLRTSSVNMAPWLTHTVDLLRTRAGISSPDGAGVATAVSVGRLRCRGDPCLRPARLCS